MGNIGKNVGARSTVDSKCDAATRKSDRPTRAHLTGGSKSAVVTPGKK